jgi:uncharacterized membrane protein
LGGLRITPLLATLTLVPWLWALPSLHRMPLQLQGSGACLVVLMLGWPLAVPVLCGVGVIAALISPMQWSTALDLTVWLGLVPATLSMGLGAALRRWLPHHLFIYILGRGYFATAIAAALAGAGSVWLHGVPPGLSPADVVLARGLAASGDAFITGMLVAIFVAFRPGWLATYADRIYLPRS